MPAFVDHFDTVAIRIEDIGRVVARIIIKARPRWAVVRRASLARRRVKRIDFLLAVGDEANMDGARIGFRKYVDYACDARFEPCFYRLMASAGTGTVRIVSSAAVA